MFKKFMEKKHYFLKMLNILRIQIEIQMFNA